MFGRKRSRLVAGALVALASLVGAAAAVAASAMLTLVLSIVVCLGLHPEAIASAEWAAPVFGLLWAGAMVRKAGGGAPVLTGAAIGLAWALAWLYLTARFDTRLWIAEALPALTWRHVLAWASAPVIGGIGGALGAHLRGRVLHTAVPVAVVLAALVGVAAVDKPGVHALGDGATVRVHAPDQEGTTVRLVTLDLASNPRLRVGLYDCDSDDSTPYDDVNTGYFGTPAPCVFERLGPDALCVLNAGFFGWSKTGRVGMHVAPVVQDGRARYDRLRGPDVWTFGWKMAGNRPRFRMLKGVPFERLTSEFDTALGHVRALVVDGKAPVLEPGAGVTGLRCSRTSLGWSKDSSKLQILIVRDPDGEKSSIADWKVKRRQVGGWDLPQVQRFWMRMGVESAVALDGGDSTQIVYRTGAAVSSVGSGRLSTTFGYLRDRPVRLWLPILPTRHSDAGVMNYIYITHHPTPASPDLLRR